MVKGFVSISYWQASTFEALDYEDSRWILRKMAMLTDADWSEIVGLSGYPAELHPLIKAKMISRLNNALETFKLPQALISPDLSKINSASGIVRAGKITQEYYPGVPQRISHPIPEKDEEYDARKSPFQDGDLGRYMSVFLRSSAMESALSRINERLQALTVEDAVQKYQTKMINKIMDHIKNRPNDPMHQQVTSWGGPLFGAHVNASRHVSTGTYSGSTAPVQLVDNVSVGVGLGVFRALDGLDTWMPLMGANVSVVRDYTHVRPILSLKEGSKEEWGKIIIPKYMANLAKALKPESTKEDKNGMSQNSLDAFLKDLRDGEVFTVTDSVALSAYLQASASIDVLLGLTPFSYLNSVTLGADASRVILRQVSFVRYGPGIQVFVREMKNRGQGMELGVNFFLNLLKVRSQMTKGSIRSDAFVIDYDPNWADKPIENEEKIKATRDNLKVALIPLLRNNNTALLYSKFPDKKFLIQHELKTNETKLKLLAWKFSNFKEDHTLKIQYPINLDFPELDPKNEEVVLLSSKRGELVGRDLLGLAFDVLDGILSFAKVKNVETSKSIGDNPADVPMGRAHWKIINSEADLSTFRTPYESVSMIDYTWGGWSMKRDKFMKVIDDVEQKFSALKLAGFKLIDRQEFNNVESLDFYRINAHLSLTAGGVAKIRDLLLQPKVAGDDKNRKAKDWALFGQLLKMLGNGDVEAGKTLYYKQCSRENPPASHIQGPDSNFRGNEYGCMSRWLYNILSKLDKYPTDRKEQTRWMTNMLYQLESKIPLSGLMGYVGEQNYIAFVRINGFRPGDEDGDLEYFSNVMGDPETNDPQANGLISMFMRKTRLLPTELERTQGSFQ